MLGTVVGVIEMKTVVFVLSGRRLELRELQCYLALKMQYRQKLGLADLTLVMDCFRVNTRGLAFSLL